MRRTARSLVLLAAITAIVTACTGAGTPTWTFPPDGPAAGVPASSEPVAAASAAPAAPAAGGAVLGTLEIESVDLGFAPTELSVDQPGRYTVALTNPHDIPGPDGQPAVANAGETATVEVDVPDSGLTFLCSIPGHAEAGMTGAITVAGSTAGGGGSDDHGGPAPATDVEPDPNAPAYTVFPAAAPPLLEGEVHDSVLVIEE